MALCPSGTALSGCRPSSRSKAKLMSWAGPSCNSTPTRRKTRSVDLHQPALAVVDLVPKLCILGR